MTQKNIKNLLIVGGAGYIGSVLSRELEKNKYIKKIYILDKLIYKNQVFCKELKKKSKIIFIKNDFRKFINKKNTIIHKISDVVMLAGLVGDPITKKYPVVSRKINEEGIKEFIIKINNYINIDKFIFISTCSNYGILKNKIANENSQLNPQSLYAKSKVKIEKFLLSNKKIKFKTCILRFATAFGLSPRMRYDLTLNQFCLEAIKKKKIDIYDSLTWRPYCHVLDFSRVIEKIIFSNNYLINKQVFNVGSFINNSRKIDIAKKIQKKLKFCKIFNLKNSSDPRDYRVSFEKLNNKLGIKPKYSIMFGINEIIKAIKKQPKLSKDIGNFSINQK